MSYAELSKEALLLELERLLQENRDLNGRAGARERLLHELTVHQVELELQNRELREAQSALEESRSRYADLYDFAPVAYLTLDSKGCIREINLTGATMLGQDRVKLIGKPFLTLVTMDDPTAFWRHLKRCAEARAAVLSELRFSTARTGVIDVQMRTAPVLDASGETMAFRTTFTDITALRKAEAERRAAHEAETRLRTRFEGLDQAWLRISQALSDFPQTGLLGVLRTIVEQARRVTGAEYAAIGIGKDPECPFEPWVAAAAEPMDVPTIGRHPRPVGILGAVVREDRTLHLSDLREHSSFLGFPPHHPPMAAFIGIPVHDQGRVSGTLYLAKKPGAEAFSADDVRTAEMLAHRAGIALELAQFHELEARERGRLSVLAETGKLLTSTLDQSISLAVLARFPLPWLADYCTVHLVEGDELRGAGFAHVDSSKETVIAELQRRFKVKRDNPVSLLAQAWRTGKPVLVSKYTPPAAAAETVLPHPVIASLARETRSTIVVPVIARGQTLAVIATAYSDSGRQYGPADVPQAEEVALRAGFALENARLFRQAEAAIRARDNVLAVVSHDLKSPLSAVRLSAGLLARPVPGKDNRKSVDVIVRSVDRMSHLIDDLLAAATIEAGRFTVEACPEDIASIVEELMLDMEPLATAKGIQLESAGTTMVPWAYCDRQRILQVLSNLAGNAIKFSPKGSHIRIETSTDERGVCFAVADSGPGIAEEEVPHLFEHYWKSKPGSKEGTGLGLFIAKGIVEAHGGRIWVETNVGGGSTFRFTIPAWRPEAVAG